MWQSVLRVLARIAESMSALSWLGYAYLGPLRAGEDLAGRDDTVLPPGSAGGTPAAAERRPAPSGPPPAHPERLVPHLPPTPAERELWANIERTDP